MRARRWRGIGIAVGLALAACAGCSREAADDAPAAAAAPGAQVDADGNVTISGDDSLAGQLTWRVPAVTLGDDDRAIADARRRADAALAEGALYADADSAIPLYLALLARDDGDRRARDGLRRALARLLADGGEALAAGDEDIEALRRAHAVAAVARAVRPEDDAVVAFLGEVDAADALWDVNRRAEAALRAGRLGADAGGALGLAREALALEPDQPRAMQTVAAVESALIRRAEEAAAAGDFAAAIARLEAAAAVRPPSATIDDARARIETMRTARIARMRDEAMAALGGYRGVDAARAVLARMIVIAQPGDPVVRALRERIDLAVHYGLFRPGQRFTDAMAGVGGRGPAMVVVPHGGFRMGARDDDTAADENERPARNLRFDRGFALSVREVTVAEFRRFIAATDRQTRAGRRGFSMAYDERSGNFVRRSGVDWRSAHDGSPATDDAPVLHVSAKDATAYVEWLAGQTGERYRLPSEAEFEYALRAGGDGLYPWGNGSPPEGAGNVTGSEDRSPGGRSWINAFRGYGDGWWGPAPVARAKPNAWGLHDLAGNASEWVADCWHDGYRRAPRDPTAWVNPGCRTQVVRGGSWSSAPAQARSSWRGPVAVDTTNGRIGFRVARDI